MTNKELEDIESGCNRYGYITSEAGKRLIEEIKRMRKQFNDQWYECHNGSDDACCKLHE